MSGNIPSTQQQTSEQRKNIVYIYDRILCNYKKDNISHFSHNLGWTRGSHAKLN